MPRLFTRMSTCGKAAIVAAQPAAVPLSATSGSTRASGCWARIAAIAVCTLAAVRPLTMTVAPSPASAEAMASPMPPEEPVMRAVWPVRWRFMGGRPEVRGERREVWERSAPGFAGGPGGARTLPAHYAAFLSGYYCGNEAVVL